MDNELQMLENLIPANKKIDRIREKYDKNSKGPKSLEELVDYLSKETNSKIFNDILNVLHKYAGCNIWCAAADDDGMVELDINEDNKLKGLKGIIIPGLRRSSMLFFPYLYEGAKGLYYDLRIGKEYSYNENEYVLPYFLVLYAFKKSEHLFDDIVVRAVKSNFITRCAYSLKGQSIGVFSALNTIVNSLNPDSFVGAEKEKREAIKNVIGIIKAIALYDECEKNNDFDSVLNSFYDVDKKMGEELDFNSDIFDLHKNALYRLRNFLANNADCLRDIDEEDDYEPIEITFSDDDSGYVKKDESKEKEEQKKKIDYKRNVRSAIIFLNTFNLILEKQDVINENTKLNIINKNGKEVGKLYFEDDFVKIKTNTNFGMMEAKYKFCEFDGLDLPEDVLVDRCFYHTWQTKIDYEIKKDGNNKFVGDILLDYNLDDKNGANVLAHPMISYYQNDKEIIKLYFQDDGNIFATEINSNGVSETIKVNLFNPYLSYLEHEIRKKDNQYNKLKFIYRYFNAVHQKSEVENDKLSTLHYIEELEKEKIWEREEYIKITKEDDTKEAIIQKGELMQKIDPKMQEKIKELRTFFKLGYTDLINNFVNISLSSYDDEEIKALLGFDRVPMIYQDNAKTKEEAYFGVGEENRFLTEQEQKRLMH